MYLLAGLVALLTESVDWNSPPIRYYKLRNLSLSSRRAWIEMIIATAPSISSEPSLSSRRAWIEMVYQQILWAISALVALLTESVDWNSIILFLSLIMTLSLSSRRAWIEIPQLRQVDFIAGSLSSRRAWIEITKFPFCIPFDIVALLTESVDWNDNYWGF